MINQKIEVWENCFHYFLLLYLQCISSQTLHCNISLKLPFFLLFFLPLFLPSPSLQNVLIDVLITLTSTTSRYYIYTTLIYCTE